MNLPEVLWPVIQYAEKENKRGEIIGDALMKYAEKLNSVDNSVTIGKGFSSMEDYGILNEPGDYFMMTLPEELWPIIQYTKKADEAAEIISNALTAYAQILNEGKVLGTKDSDIEGVTGVIHSFIM